jgi:glycosyltransferase involved in cell wall biosynthesis
MELNLIAPICDTGYGVVGRNIVHSLTNQGHKVHLTPINDRKTITAPYRMRQQISQSIQLGEFSNPKHPCIRLWHQDDMRLFSGNPRVGFTFFELDTLDTKERWNLSLCDHLFVACKWQQDICSKYGIKSHVIPLGVDTSVFYPHSIKRIVADRNQKYIFLNVGKWEVRKGHLELAKAFNSAFCEADNVELWMMNTNHFYTPEQTAWWEEYYKSMCHGKVRFIPWLQSDEEVAGIMSRASCGVFPAKAEAWNLELLEMMACNKPVIATNYAGHTEFLNNVNSYTIEPEGLEPAIDACGAHPNGFWFKGKGNWAKISVDKLAEQMRKVYDHRITENVNGLLTAKTFTWDNTSREIIEYLCSIKNI